ncbi:MAG: hypothetical protein ACI9KN_002535 [Gammaproteobacteria bacterium]|jgi:hypothetical protein
MDTQGIHCAHGAGSAKLGSPAPGVSPWMECMLNIVGNNISRVWTDHDMSAIFAMKGSPRGAYFW